MEKEKEEKKNREGKRGTYLEMGDWKRRRKRRKIFGGGEEEWRRKQRKNVKGPHGPKTFLIGRVVQWVGGCVSISCKAPICHIYLSARCLTNLKKFMPGIPVNVLPRDLKHCVGIGPRFLWCNVMHLQLQNTHFTNLKGSQLQHFPSIKWTDEGSVNLSKIFNVPFL